MLLRNKYYPYPVIIEGGDYYINSSFDAEVEQEIEGYNVKLLFRAELNNDEIQDLLDAGMVEIVYHIECPQTCFRTCFRTRDKVSSYLLKDTEVNGNVQVCSFIVAKKNIDKYTNRSFSADYAGFRFDIEKGCVMAIGSQLNVRVNKIRDDLANTSSIFSIVPNKDQMETTVITDLSKNRIVIMLPEKTYGLYANMQNYMDVQPAMHAMIIIPALMYALNEIKQDKEQLYNYEEHRWFRSLKKACEGIGITISEETLANIDTYKTAQLLLNSPVLKAMEYLGTEGGSYEA